MALCKPKRKFHQNLRALKRKKKEIKKFQLHWKNWEKSAELKTKQRDKLWLKESNNTLLTTKSQLRMSSVSEELPNWMDKSMFQPNLKLPSLSEFGVSTNLIQDQSESWDFSDFVKSTTEPLSELTKLQLICSEKLNPTLPMGK